MRHSDPPSPGIYLRRDPTDAGNRIAVAFDGRGVQIARFTVPPGTRYAEVRLHLEALLSLHRPMLHLVR